MRKHTYVTTRVSLDLRRLVDTYQSVTRRAICTPRIIAYARVSTDTRTPRTNASRSSGNLAREDRVFDEFVEETISGIKHVADRKLGESSLGCRPATL